MERRAGCSWVVALLVVAGISGACAVPGKVHVPHPVPAPARGDEVSLSLLATSGYPGNAAAGEISWAHRIGDLGLSLNFGVGLEVEGWYQGMNPLAVLGLGLAVPVRKAETAATGQEFVLVDLGMTASILGGTPQVAVGYLWAAPAQDSGLFGGLRVGGGLLIAPDVEGSLCMMGCEEDEKELDFQGFEPGGGLIYVSGGFGYRWSYRYGRRFLTLQANPIISVDIRLDEAAVSGGVVGSLTYSFDF